MSQANGAGPKLPLRERLPEYLAVFSGGLAVAAAVGLLIGGLSSVAVASAVGYAIVMLGVVLLWAGGASGSGYSRFGLGEGAIRVVFLQGIANPQGRQHPPDRAGDEDAVERIRRGMRREASPRAFWEIIGGVLYIGIGLAVAVLTKS